MDDNRGMEADAAETGQPPQQINLAERPNDDLDNSSSVRTPSRAREVREWRQSSNNIKEAIDLKNMQKLSMAAAPVDTFPFNSVQMKKVEDSIEGIGSVLE